MLYQLEEMTKLAFSLASSEDYLHSFMMNKFPDRIFIAFKGDTWFKKRKILLLLEEICLS